jgi:hypothetical protein
MSDTAATHPVLYAFAPQKPGPDPVKNLMKQLRIVSQMRIGTKFMLPIGN